MNKLPSEKDKKSQKKRVIRIIALSIVSVILLLGIIDIGINFSYKRLPDKPSHRIDTDKINYLLFYFENPLRAQQENIIIDNNYIIEAVTPIKEYIDGRYDCFDFNMHTALRLQYLYGDEIKQISPEGSRLIKETFVNAKYWMTEKGKDSMCFWSENHQILFAVAEYLAGMEWRDKIFTNDNSTGYERMKRARSRINYWMEHRYKYGFSEFNSTNYAPFNLGPMANFIQFAADEDRDMAERMKMILDLQLYDIASNMYKYTFMAPAARAYVDNMVGIAGDKTRKYTDYIWNLNDEWKDNTHRMMLNFISMLEGKDNQGKPFYEVPKVILEIGKDIDTTREIKSSSGLNLNELEAKGYIGHTDNQIMMQLGMEAMTNPEVIRNTITYYSKNRMLNNYFLNDFKYFNLTLLKIPGVMRFISKQFNPMPNGIALQRGNIYTYRTPYYQLATAQAYHPGSYGSSQMLSIANFTENAVVFTTHPARHNSSKNAAAVPGYWAGYGRAPHQVQYKNIQLSLYQLPAKSGFLELYEVPQFTHTYLPEAFFDEVIVEGKCAFARVGSAYLALIGASELEYLEHDTATSSVFNNGLQNYPDKRFDLVQRGLNQFWIYELSDATNESFEQFKERIKASNISYNGKDKLEYTNGSNSFELNYKGHFKVNNEIQDMEYKRFDCEYITADREAEEFIFSYKGYELVINYNEVKRSHS